MDWDRKDIPCLVSPIHRFEQLPIFFCQSRHNQIVGVCNPLLDELLRQAAVHAYRIPVFLVHVVAGNYSAGILLPELNRLNRIALEVDAFKFLDIADGEDLAHHLETERILIEGQIFGCAREGETEVAVGFDVHFGVRSERSPTFRGC